MPIPTKKWRLANGLTVVFEPSDKAKVVSINIGVRVGSAHEQDSESGLCHLIEHMVFKGSPSFATGEMATRVEGAGGEFNAYTSLDQTVYYVNLPSHGFELGLKIVKEMVFDALMDAEELEREKEVVVEEIKRGRDTPQRVLSETLFSNFFSRHPYRRPVIGTEELVRSTSREKLLSFYKTRYVPANMVLGVCGNIGEEALRAQLDVLFSRPSDPPPADPVIAVEPVRDSPLVIARPMDVSSCFFELAMPAPPLTHADVPALDLLSHLTGESDTSLLEQEVKEKRQLVHAIYTSCFTPRFAGLFSIGGQADPIRMPEVLAAIRAAIHNVRETLFESEKLERAKAMARSHLIYEKETFEGTARRWMIYETTVGDFDYDKKYLEALERVTATEVREMARKYLKPEQAVLAMIHPKDNAPRLGKNPLTDGPAPFPRARKPSKACQDIALFRLRNGLRVLVRENHRLPLVSLKLASLGGLRHESRTNAGISQLIANVLPKGTRSLSQLQIAEKCEWLSGSIGGYAGRNSAGMAFGFLSDRTPHAIPLLADVCLNPAFAPDEVKKEKALQLEALRNQSDNPAQLVFHAVMARLFAGHPYEHSVLGSPAAVRSLTPKRLHRHHHHLLTPKNTVISVSGDVATDRLLDLLQEHFGGLKTGTPRDRKIRPPKRPGAVVTIFTPREREQAHLVMGFLSASTYDKDKHAMEILHNVLSGQGGRLFLNLRDRQSLAYSVSTTLLEGLETGFFGAYIGCDPHKTTAAMQGIQGELQRLLQEGVSAAELTRAKNYIIGTHLIDHQKNGAVAMQLCLNELYGLGFTEFFGYEERIRAVGGEDVLRAARKYLTLSDCVVSVVGPKKIRSAVTPS